MGGTPIRRAGLQRKVWNEIALGDSGPLPGEPEKCSSLCVAAGGMEWRSHLDGPTVRRFGRGVGRTGPHERIPFDRLNAS